MSDNLPDWCESPYSTDGGRGPTDSMGNSKYDANGVPNFCYGGNRDACFAATAKVLTTRGLQRIDSLQVGQIVLSYDVAKRELSEQRVRKVLAYTPKRVVALSYEGASEPTIVTPSHTICTENGWKRVGELSRDDKLLVMRDGVAGVASILSVDAVEKKEPVFNLRTGGSCTFIAGGLIAHNFTYFRALRTAISQVAERSERLASKLRPSYVLGS